MDSFVFKKIILFSSQAEYLQGLLPKSAVVKAFNVLSAYLLENGSTQGAKEVWWDIQIKSFRAYCLLAVVPKKSGFSMMPDFKVIICVSFFFNLGFLEPHQEKKYYFDPSQKCQMKKKLSMIEVLSFSTLLPNFESVVSAIFVLGVTLYLY